MWHNGTVAALPGHSRREYIRSALTLSESLAVADLRPSVQDALADRYVVQRELGRGGMATVYLAQDVKHERPVALKVLRRGVAESMGAERFLREIKLAAKLQHPHILALYDSGEADGALFYVTPYIEGESLGQRLKRESRLPLDDALQLTREIADALDYAHERNVIHRDIKPDNILLAGTHAIVADFGIARAIVRASEEALTQKGFTLGTPAYMSPEQVTGEADLDGRSDQYSLACVLYEMLAGQPVFTGPSVQVVISKRISEPAPTLRALGVSVPPWVGSAVARALSRHATDRFPTAAAFASALRPPRADSPQHAVGSLDDEALDATTRETQLLDTSTSHPAAVGGGQQAAQRTRGIRIAVAAAGALLLAAGAYILLR